MDADSYFFRCLLYSFRFEDELQTTHLPEMVFGESFLSLQHLQTGIKLHFNALDALKGWKKEALPPVEVPAAAKWKFRRFSIHLASTSSNGCWSSFTLLLFHMVPNFITVSSFGENINLMIK